MKCNKWFCAFVILTQLSACHNDVASQEAVRPVKTWIVQGDNAQFQRAYPGKVIAGQRADLSFQVGGTLMSLPVKEGQRVKEGDLLAKLNPLDYQNRYVAAKSNVDTAALNYERGEKLIASGTIAKSAFDDLKNKFEAAKSEAEIARKALNDTVIYAPFNGLIAKTYVDNYQEVQPKEKILSLQDIDAIDILIDMPEKDVALQQSLKDKSAHDRELTNAYVTFDAIPDKKFTVSVKEYATEADPTTQTYRVRLTMRAPAGVTILPGMTAYLNAQGTHSLAQFVIPIAAVAIDAQGNYYVWKVNAENAVQRQAITVGPLHNDGITVASGLTAGDVLVVAGLDELQDGMKVERYQGAP